MSQFLPFESGIFILWHYIISLILCELTVKQTVSENTLDFWNAWHVKTMGTMWLEWMHCVLCNGHGSVGNRDRTLWFGCEISTIDWCVWKRGPQLAVVFRTLVDPLRSSTLREEMGHWRWAWQTTSLPVHPFLPDCLHLSPSHASHDHLALEVRITFLLLIAYCQLLCHTNKEK